MVRSTGRAWRSKNVMVKNQGDHNHIDQHAHEYYAIDETFF